MIKQIPHIPLAKINLLFLAMLKLHTLATKGQSSFGDVSFKPIFLWKISDKLFAEAEIEIETGEGTANLGLEYANMCYMVNPYLIVHAGRFLPKFGAYRGRGGEAFLNRFASDPAGFGDGGIGAMNETGIGAEGGLPFGDIKINYDSLHFKWPAITYRSR